MTTPETANDARPAPHICALVAVDGTTFHASWSDLARCDFFAGAASGRWKQEKFVLPASADSLRVLLELLWYGPSCAPSLEPPLRDKVLHDANYLGVPSELWAHLRPDPDAEEKATRRAREEWACQQASMESCDSCRRFSCRLVWRCIGCHARTKREDTFFVSAAGQLREFCELGWRGHECPTCGLEFAEPHKCCLLCSRPLSQSGGIH